MLAANAKWRARVVAHGRASAAANPPARATEQPAPPARRRYSWADLMRRAFDFDLLSCPRCAGKMVLLACILERAVIRKILAHLGLPTELPKLAPARGSPHPELPFDHVA